METVQAALSPSGSWRTFGLKSLWPIASLFPQVCVRLFVGQRLTPDIWRFCEFEVHVGSNVGLIGPVVVHKTLYGPFGKVIFFANISRCLMVVKCNIPTWVILQKNPQNKPNKSSVFGCLTLSGSLTVSVVGDESNMLCPIQLRVDVGNLFKRLLCKMRPSVHELKWPYWTRSNSLSLSCPVPRMDLRFPNPWNYFASLITEEQSA